MAGGRDFFFKFTVVFICFRKVGALSAPILKNLIDGFDSLIA